ncbi:MAG: helix-turn-helix domain-containing protein [Ruminococcus sp.]|nr:helix-turn-helix domain-containing protein [Ruminococcus sp.]
MNSYVTGNTIKILREQKNLTQRQLAEMISVSDKTISKWETGRGLPDITLIEPLSSALGVSVTELLSGECVSNRNRCANMLRSCFYVCPACGNVIHSTGEGNFTCCGISLPLLSAEEQDSEHIINAEITDGDYYITLNHPMTKTHYISFIAYVTINGIQLVKLYPEQNPEVRFNIRGRDGYILAYCNHHGLFRTDIRKLII